jgi:hypothetical protein
VKYTIIFKNQRGIRMMCIMRDGEVKGVTKKFQIVQLVVTDYTEAEMEVVKNGFVDMIKRMAKDELTKEQADIEKVKLKATRTGTKPLETPKSASQPKSDTAGKEDGAAVAAVDVPDGKPTGAEEDEDEDDGDDDDDEGGRR